MLSSINYVETSNRVLKMGLMLIVSLISVFNVYWKGKIWVFRRKNTTLGGKQLDHMQIYHMAKGLKQLD